MSRVFRCGLKYASIETGRALSYVCIEGEGHITDARNTKTPLDCVKLLHSLAGGEWRWIA